MASISLTLEQIDICIAAVSQLCGRAAAANEADLLDRATVTVRVLEDAVKELRRQT